MESVGCGLLDLGPVAGAEWSSSGPCCCTDSGAQMRVSTTPHANAYCMLAKTLQIYVYVTSVWPRQARACLLDMFETCSRGCTASIPDMLCTCALLEPCHYAICISFFLERFSSREQGSVAGFAQGISHARLHSASSRAAERTQHNTV